MTIGLDTRRVQELYPAIQELDGHLKTIGDPHASWTGVELLLDGIAQQAERESAAVLEHRGERAQA